MFPPSLTLFISLSVSSSFLFPSTVFGKTSSQAAAILRLERQLSVGNFFHSHELWKAVSLLCIWRSPACLEKFYFIFLFRMLTLLSYLSLWELGNTRARSRLGFRRNRTKKTKVMQPATRAVRRSSRIISLEIIFRRPSQLCSRSPRKIAHKVVSGVRARNRHVAA